MNIHRYVFIQFGPKATGSGKVFCLHDFVLQHFTDNKPIIGIEYEAQLQKSILPGQLNVLTFLIFLVLGIL